MKDHDDRQLLTNIAKGDNGAMQVFYQRYYDPLFYFIKGRTNDTATVEDVLHDTMLAVWRNAEKYSGGPKARAWVFTIARNKLVDRFRRNKRLAFTDDVPEVTDSAPDAVSVIAASQDATQVRNCLTQLKDAQRSIIHLAYFEGLNYDEIAAIEDVPAGTVKSRIFYAKKALMHCLSECQTGLCFAD